MLDQLTRFVQNIIPIRREEWLKTILMFFYFFFTISTLYILKPIRSAMFLTAHGAESLRYAYVGEGLFLIFVTLAYVQLAKWLPKRHLLFSAATGFYVVNILIFWALFRMGYTKWLAYFFYVWVASYSVTIVTQFWTLANDIFNPQEAKRLFGFILSGGSLGGILGGLVTNRTARLIGTENLLLLAAGLLSLCLILIHAVWRMEHRERLKVESKKIPPASVRLPERSTFKLFAKYRYLFFITALVAITKIASTLIDNQFNWVVDHSILEKDAKTAFFGGFMAVLNVVSFLMQLVAAAQVLRRFGIGLALLLLPIGLCVGSVTTIFFPWLIIAQITKIYDGSMNYSVSQLSKEILYLPIPSHVRYQAKPLIDMLGYRVSKSLAGFLIILMTPLLGISDEKLGIVVVLLVPLWILTVWGVRDGYVQAIHELLSVPESQRKKLYESKTEELRETLAHLETERSFEQLKQFLDHPSSVARKLSATACLVFYAGAKDVGRLKRLALELLRYEALELKGINLNLASFENVSPHPSVLDVYLAELLKAERSSELDLKTFLLQEEKKILLKIAEFLDDPHAEIGDKRKAALLLTVLGTQGAVDILVNALASAQDHSIRFNEIRALNRIRAKGEGLLFNRWIVKKEILREVKTYRAISALISEYKTHVSNRQTLAPAAAGFEAAEEEYLLATLRAVQEESLERVFRMLALIYESDMIHVVYDRIHDFEQDQDVKANALELLENVLEPELARTLVPIFDRRHRFSREERIDCKPVLEDFLKGGDRWLTVIAVFLIAALNQKQFCPLVSDLKHSSVPILREAAEIASLRFGTTL